jgi:hypothetical protein
MAFSHLVAVRQHVRIDVQGLASSRQTKPFKAVFNKVRREIVSEVLACRANGGRPESRGRGRRAGPKPPKPWHRPLPFGRRIPRHSLPPRRHPTPLRTQHPHKPDFETVASVSGGSLTCAQWAIAEARRKGTVAEGNVTVPVEATLGFTRDIARPILTLTGTDLRTGPLAKKLIFPWNWFRGAYATNAMVARFETAFGKGTLNLLPDQPRFSSAPPTWP